MALLQFPPPQRSQRHSKTSMMTTLLPSSHLLAALAHFRCLILFLGKACSARILMIAAFSCAAISLQFATCIEIPRYHRPPFSPYIFSSFLARFSAACVAIGSSFHLCFPACKFPLFFRCDLESFWAAPFPRFAARAHGVWRDSCLRDTRGTWRLSFSAASN